MDLWKRQTNNASDRRMPRIPDLFMMFGGLFPKVSEMGSPSAFYPMFVALLYILV